MVANSERKFSAFEIETAASARPFQSLMALGKEELVNADVDPKVCSKLLVLKWHDSL